MAHDCFQKHAPARVSALHRRVSLFIMIFFLFIAGMFCLFEGNLKKKSSSLDLATYSDWRKQGSSQALWSVLAHQWRAFSPLGVSVCVCLPRARSALCCRSARAVRTHCVREVRKATALSLTHAAPGRGTRPLSPRTVNGWKRHRNRHGQLCTRALP